MLGKIKIERQTDCAVLSQFCSEWFVIKVNIRIYQGASFLIGFDFGSVNTYCFVNEKENFG